jgi:hypothetical protein
MEMFFILDEKLHPLRTANCELLTQPTPFTKTHRFIHRETDYVQP